MCSMHTHTPQLSDTSYKPNMKDGAGPRGNKPLHPKPADQLQKHHINPTARFNQFCHNSSHTYTEHTPVFLDLLIQSKLAFM